MRRIAILAGAAILIVIVPALLDRALPATGTVLAAPLIPGLCAAALLERTELIEAMDSSGDFTVAAAAVMYAVSFTVWFGIVSTIAAGMGRVRRARVALVIASRFVR
jgi:hypothetical protein